MAALFFNCICLYPEPLLFSQGEVRFLDQYAFQRHCVAAAIPGLEKITITVPPSIFKRNLVGIVLPLEGNRKSIDLNSIPFGGIQFGFLDFPNHS